MLGKLGAFGKDVLLSFIFGAGNQTDAYFVANAIPGLVFAGFLSTISLVFLPIYTRAKLQSGRAARSAVQTAIGLYMAVSCTMTVITLIFADVFVNLIAPDAPIVVLDLASLLTRIMSFGFMFSGWVGLNNAMLQASNHFIWPIAVPAFNHAFVIAGLLLAWSYNGSILIVVAFAVGGWVLQAPLVWWRAKSLYHICPFNSFSRIYLRQLVLLSVPVFFSVSLDQFNTLVDLYLSSQFGTGAISHLSYASRLMLLLAGLFSLLVSYFVFPYLARSLAAADLVLAKRQITRAFVLMLFFTTPLALFCLVRSAEIIKIVFGHGDFGTDDIAETAKALRFYAVGMVFIGAREIFNRVFLADQRALALFVFGFIAAMINVAASIFFIPTLGLAGIALGTSCGAASYVILQTLFLLVRHRQIISPLLAVAVGLSAISGLTMVWSIEFGIFDKVGSVGPAWALLSLLMNGILYVAVFAILFAATLPVLGKKGW
jgi:putative peptidoglycan lipid II flippase